MGMILGSLAIYIEEYGKFRAESDMSRQGVDVGIRILMMKAASSFESSWM